MTRYRLVTRTTTARGSEEHVSSVIQTQEEILDDLDVEESLARAAGWATARLVGRPHPELVCHRGRIIRWISVRESSWDTDIITRDTAV